MSANRGQPNQPVAGPSTHWFKRFVGINAANKTEIHLTGRKRNRWAGVSVLNSFLIL